MSRTLKPLARQAAVLTGAAPGIGLAAARAATDGYARRSSQYARAQLSPRALALVLILLSAALMLLNAVRARRRAPRIRAAARF